jgi:hypothetical protein
LLRLAERMQERSDGNRVRIAHIFELATSRDVADEYSTRCSKIASTSPSSVSRRTCSKTIQRAGRIRFCDSNRCAWWAVEGILLDRAHRSSSGRSRFLEILQTPGCTRHMPTS